MSSGDLLKINADFAGISKHRGRAILSTDSNFKHSAEFNLYDTFISTGEVVTNSKNEQVEKIYCVNKNIFAYITFPFKEFWELFEKVS